MEKLDEETIEQIETIISFDVKYGDGFGNIEYAHAQQYLEILYEWYKRATA